jgi:hypothetical protein
LISLEEGLAPGLHRFEKELPMRRNHCWSTFLLLLAMGCAQASSQALGGGGSPGGSHGTAVHMGKAWEAFNKGAQENKLLFLVHISGIFEDPTFT